MSALPARENKEKMKVIKDRRITKAIETHIKHIIYRNNITVLHIQRWTTKWDDIRGSDG